jgi:NAD(P)-dependent dehydrogenase (short-subunit alcohol dehydrogenase family)
MTDLLQGRVALVTGAARGLGRAIVERFAAEGAAGLAVDLDDGPAHSWHCGLPSAFEAAFADVTREDEQRTAIADAVRKHGRLDIVVANAGVVPPWRETEALDFDEWDAVMAVNARGVAATLKHAASAMKAKGGAIILMASINAFQSHPRQLLYTATKHSVLGMIRAASSDLGRYGIRVNGLAPGPIATAALLKRIHMRAAADPAETGTLERLTAGTALRRLASAEDVAKAAVFLASDLSSGVTGVLLPVDAGRA